MITFAVTNITGASSVSGDDGAGSFPAVYDSDNFSFLVTFTATDDITLLPVPIDSVACTITFAGINITIVDSSSFIVSGSYSGIFNDFYSFRMKDGSIQVLNDYNSLAVGIFNWSFPAIRKIISTFAAKVIVQTVETDMTLTQNIYWNLSPHIIDFERIVAEGM